MSVDVVRAQGSPNCRLDLGRTTSLPAPDIFRKQLTLRPSDRPGSFPAGEPNVSPQTRTWRFGPFLGVDGSSAKVRLALDCVSGRIMAVKSVAVGGLPREMRQLEQEQAVLQQLCGLPNIVQFLFSDWTHGLDGAPQAKHLILEHVSGGSLSDVMASFGGALPQQLVRWYARGILQGLAGLHSRGLVHCDVRARNVLVCSNSGQPKLCSFGYVIRDGEAADRIQRKQRLQGTYQWMAPEVIRQENQTAASDIWSFGCTLVELLTNGPPWGEQTLRQDALVQLIGHAAGVPELPVEISPECRNFVLRCLERDPAARPTAQQLLRDPFLKPCSPSKSPQRCSDGSSPQRTAGRMASPRPWHASPRNSASTPDQRSPRPGRPGMDTLPLPIHGSQPLRTSSLSTPSKSSNLARKAPPALTLPNRGSDCLAPAVTAKLGSRAAAGDIRPGSPEGHYGVELTPEFVASVQARPSPVGTHCNILMLDREEPAPPCQLPPHAGSPHMSRTFSPDGPRMIRGGSLGAPEAPDCKVSMPAGNVAVAGANPTTRGAGSLSLPMSPHSRLSCTPSPGLKNHRRSGSVQLDSLSEEELEVGLGTGCPRGDAALPDASPTNPSRSQLLKSCLRRSSSAASADVHSDRLAAQVAVPEGPVTGSTE